MAADCSNKVAVVTGASRGIGRSIAVALGQAGATVIATGRDEAQLDQTAQLVRQAGGQARTYSVDLRRAQEISAFAEMVGKNFPEVHILVNNAGVTCAGPIDSATTADWDDCLAVNARAAFLMCRDLLPLIRKNRDAKIINISSVVGVKGYANQVIYTASKHALRGMSIALAQELKDEGIRVHVICPGGVDTDMVRTVRPDIPQQDLIQPEEIAEMVLYLVTHEGNAVMDEIHLRRAGAEPWFG